MNNVKPISATKTCHFRPGIEIDGNTISSCEVKLLTRSEQKRLANPDLPEDERDNLFLALSIASFGEVTDKTELMLALESLTVVDELKIRQTLSELEQEYLKPVKPPVLQRLAIGRTTDILSEPFALNPGIQAANGTWQRSCVVRLIRRGEWKHIQAQPDAEKREDLSLLYSIVQIGDIFKVEPEHIDDLVEPDIERINTQVEVLRERYALDTKSAQG